MDERTAKLRNDVRLLKVYAAVLTVAFLGLAVFGFAPGHQGDDIVRTQGVIIVDEEGRERILIGAPVPHADARVRTDLDRIAETWAPRYPDPEEYLEAYRELLHGLNGMVVLDEGGFDRIALGDPVPDPIIGRRVAPATGLLINNREGLERTGYGLLEVDGKYRVALGLDDDRGEGVVLSLHEEGPRGLTVREGGDGMFLGHAPEGSWPTADDDLRGLVIHGADDVEYELNTAKEDRPGA